MPEPAVPTRSWPDSPTVELPMVPQVGTGADASRPDRHRVVRSAVIWSYVLTIGRYSVGTVVTFVLAALITPREFGVMALAMVWVWFSQVLALHGPAQAVVQREEVTHRHFDAAFWVTLATSLVLAGLFAVLAPIWATVNGVPELSVVCWALTPAIVLNALVAIPDAMLRRELRFRALSVRVLVAGLLSGVVGVGIALAGYGVWALVAQQLTVSAVSLVAVWIAVDWRPRLRGFGPALRDLRRFPLLSVTEFLAYAASSRADALLLGAFFGPLAIGLYRFALRLVEIVMELGAGGLNQVTLPDLSRLTEDRATFAARLGRILHIGMAITLPILGVLAAAGPHLLAVLGPEWTDAATGLRILCLAAAFMVLGTILAPAIQAMGRPGTGAIIGWTEAAVMVAAVIVVGNVYENANASTQVAAMATTLLSVMVLAVSASAVVAFRVVLRQPLSPALRPMLPAVLAGALALAVGWYVGGLLTGLAPILALLIVGAAAGLVAVGIMLLLDRFVAEQAGRVLRRFRRA